MSRLAGGASKVCKSCEVSRVGNADGAIGVCEVNRVTRPGPGGVVRSRKRFSGAWHGRSESRPEVALPLIALLIVAVLLFSLSCAVRKPVEVGVPAKRCAARTMTLLEKNTSNLRTITGTLRIHVTAEEPGFSGRVQAGLAAQRADRARLKIYAGFVHVADIAIDGDSLWAFLPPRAILLQGSVKDTAVPLAAGALLSALGEALFPASFCSGACSTAKVGGGICRIEEELSEGRRVSFVEAKSGRLQAIHLLDAEGDEWVEVDYRDYRRSGRTRFPHDIRISFPSSKLRMRLLFDRVKLNPPLDEDSFRPNVPPGTTVRRFGDLREREGEEILREEGLFGRER